MAVVIYHYQWASSVSLVFPTHHCHFLLKIHVLLAALTVAVAYAITALIDLKIQLTAINQYKYGLSFRFVSFVDFANFLVLCRIPDIRLIIYAVYLALTR